MLTLLKSERFQKEYKEFFDKINTIEDKDLKNQLSRLLGDLVNEVKKLDSRHLDISSSVARPDVGDAKMTILELRKTLVRRLEEHSKSNI
jgi:CCR4-NOT transcriptional regulation complex NOT5 subunit